jgi:hypothetical protein
MEIPFPLRIYVPYLGVGGGSVEVMSMALTELAELRPYLPAMWSHKFRVSDLGRRTVRSRDGETVDCYVTEITPDPGGKPIAEYLRHILDMKPATTLEQVREYCEWLCGKET